MRALIAAFKAQKPSVKIASRCCGSYAPIIPELIEIGVEVLNALQSNAEGMDLGLLKRRYGDRVSFFGGLDTQQVLPSALWRRSSGRWIG